MQTLVGDWYIPKPKRGILAEELGSGRVSVRASLEGGIIVGRLRVEAGFCSGRALNPRFDTEVEELCC